MRARVWLKGASLSHVVQLGVLSRNPALCGKNPWPDHWRNFNEEPPPLCAGCAQVMKGQRR